MTDVLNDALLEATLAVFLGSRTIPAVTSYDHNGQPVMGIVTIESAFTERLRAMAYKGEFDPILHEAMDKVSSDAIARAVEGRLADQIMEGLKSTSTFGGRSEPNWLQQQAKSIAVEAITAALKEDETLKDTLRARIGVEVDRNRVGISVVLSDPESVSS